MLYCTLDSRKSLCIVYRYYACIVSYASAAIQTYVILIMSQLLTEACRMYVYIYVHAFHSSSRLYFELPPE